MRKIIVQEMLTVDGFFCGPNGEIDWHNVDAEFNAMAAGFLDSIDTLMFGRITFELMARYWPTPDGLKDDPVIAGKMNALKKIYFSKTPETMTWEHSTMLGEINAEEILNMKQAPGKDIAVFGSGVIVEALTALGLIDEYRFIYNPVILGQGRTLFPGLGRNKLRLTESRAFASGNLLACYVRA